MEVSENSDVLVENSGKLVKGMGGAMVGSIARKISSAMMHK
jgi:hypothetical protein